MVPARGGSKSIAQKNLVPVCGIPLLEFGISAALSSGLCSRIICSTDDAAISECARKLGIEVDERPQLLGGDDVPVSEVAQEMLSRLGGEGGAALPAILVLVQPTSPFLTADQIGKVVAALAADSEANSAQNVTPVPHNMNAIAQREVDGNRVHFRFPKERHAAFNKQRKPPLHKFGNLVATRPSVLLEGHDFFSEPSVPVSVATPYDFDLDGPADVAMAEAILHAGLVDLPHMSGRIN